MYNANDINLIYANGVAGALSNICHGDGYNNWATVIELRDAVEDSEDTNSLLHNLNLLNLIGMENMTLDRDTPAYTRIKGNDPLGNIHYLRIGKE